VVRVRNRTELLKIVLFLSWAISLSISACFHADSKRAEKVFNLPLIANPSTLDPAFSEDQYSNIVLSMIYEPLYQYAYLKRPLTLEPCLAKNLPKISADQMTYDIELKSGVYFTDDPAFKATNGKGRELHAEDVVYTIKRIADAKLKTKAWWLFDKRIKGLNEFFSASAKPEPTNYAAAIEGLQVTGPYSLRIHLIAQYPQLLYALAMPFSAIVPHEVVEYYGADFVNHPIGTGPFKLSRYVRDLEIVLNKNPHYRQDYYPSTGEPEDAASGLLTAAGKRLPFLDKVVVKIFREATPRWLNFIDGKLDFSDVPKDNFNAAFDEQLQLREEFSKKGIRFQQMPQTDLVYLGFNMSDPLLGKNVNLRRAISLAVDAQKRIELIFTNRAVSAQGPIPPPLVDYEPALHHPYKGQDLKRAKELLAQAGYPNGRGLPTLLAESIVDTTQQQNDALLVQELQDLGIRLKINASPWPKFLEKIQRRQAPMFYYGWSADYPDADNFLAIFYGPNATPGANVTNFHNAAYDRLYEQMRVMPVSPLRHELINQMVTILNDEVPAVFVAHRILFNLY
jgi:ABC-type transport system substrate-binding protein